MLADVLVVTGVLGSGITAGVLFAVAVSVAPALSAMTAERYVEAHRLLGRNWDPTMPLIVSLSALADLVLAILTGDGAARLLLVIATVLLVGVSGVSHLLNVPLNRSIEALPPGGPLPRDWDDPRPAWRVYHVLRTALAAVAFALNAVTAAVLS